MNQEVKLLPYWKGLLRPARSDFFIKIFFKGENDNVYQNT